MAWTDGLSAEEIGHAQSRGWDKMEPDAAAREALKGHRSATVKLGIEPDRVLRVPDKGDEAGWNTVYKAIGVPETPEGYTFDGLDDSTKALLKQTAAALRLPASQAAKLAEQFTTWNKTATDSAKITSDAATAAAETDRLTKQAATKAANLGALQGEWNPAGGYDANYQRAARAAVQLGYTAEDIGELAGTDKYVPFMRRMLAIDKAAGEAPLHGGQGGGNPRGTPRRTEEQLLARKEELFASVRGKMLKGDDHAKISAEMMEVDRELVLLRHSRRQM